MTVAASVPLCTLLGELVNQRRRHSAAIDACADSESQSSSELPFHHFDQYGR